MKKQYQQPDMEVVAINGASQLLDGSPVVETNVGMKYGGGSSTEQPRSEEYFDMGDDDLDW